ncbi:MAG: hypothetical protein QMD92_07900, partial [bacterium]|nr:hypothetical protein [bacterium]
IYKLFCIYCCYFAVSLLGYIVQEYGKRSINKLIQAIGRGCSIDMAMYRSTGKKLSEVINGWKSFIGKRYKWISIFPTIFSLWFVVSILVVFLYIHKRRKNAQKILTSLTDLFPRFIS